MSINTLAGIKPIECTVRDGQVTTVTVEMGAPRLDCSDVPMNCHGRFLEGELEADGVKVRGTAVSMGNPHFIIFQELRTERCCASGRIWRGTRLPAQDQRRIR